MSKKNEKIVVIGFFPSPTTGEESWEFMELSEAKDVFENFLNEKPFSGKFKIMTKTRKWYESLEELL